MNFDIFQRILSQEILEWADENADQFGAACTYAIKSNIKFVPELRESMRKIGVMAQANQATRSIFVDIKNPELQSPSVLGEIISHEIKHINQGDLYPEAFGRSRFLADLILTIKTGENHMSENYAFLNACDSCTVRAVIELDAYSFGRANHDAIRPLEIGFEENIANTALIARLMRAKMYSGQYDINDDITVQLAEIETCNSGLKYLETYFGVVPLVNEVPLDVDKLAMTTGGLWCKENLFAAFSPKDIEALSERVEIILKDKKNNSVKNFSVSHTLART